MYVSVYICIYQASQWFLVAVFCLIFVVAGFFLLLFVVLGLFDLIRLQLISKLNKQPFNSNSVY